MTEQQWATCRHWGPMVHHLRSCNAHRTKAGRRRLRLLACAWARRVARLMTEDGRRWLDLGERYADGLLEEADRVAALVQTSPGFFPTVPEDEVERVRMSMTADWSAYFTLASKVLTAIECASLNAAGAVGIEGVPRGTSGDDHDAELRSHAPLVREVFGNVFRPVLFRTHWRAGDVASLARAAYRERDPAGYLDLQRLAILADALDDVGCTQELLAHLRSPGPHVRGCWALDLMLGNQ